MGGGKEKSKTYVHDSAADVLCLSIRRVM